MSSSPPWRDPAAYLRSLLILGRTSNLPTVWSNCLAGWLLGGGGQWGKLGFLFVGATLVYWGGMFLNDAFDAEFDRAHRPERPIPSGQIERNEVWIWGFAWLGLGMLCLLVLGSMTAPWVALLVFTILAYDALHKWFVLSPVLMAACRVWLIVLAASTGGDGVTGHALWSALAMGAYIAGLSYLARKESGGVLIRRWPLLLLAVPILFALLINGPGYRGLAILCSIVVAGWCVGCLRWSFWRQPPQVGKSVAGLLGGIPLVDCLSTCGQGWWLFAACFALALWFQKRIPAT